MIGLSLCSSSSCSKLAIKQGLLDLAGNLLAKPLFDELLRERDRGGNPGTTASLVIVAERLTKLFLNITAWDADFEVLFAGADVGDLDVKIEPGLGLGGRAIFGGAVGRGELLLPQYSSTAVLHIRSATGW